MTDVLTVIMARIDPQLAPAVAPLIDEVRTEYGGREHYIASPRAQRQRQMLIALRTQKAAAVAQRYRVSKRTAQRLRKED